MKLHVLKFPDSQTLASCREVPDAAPDAPPAVTMTHAEFDTWKNSFTWSEATVPAYDPATQKVVFNGYIFDEGARTAVKQWAVVSLDSNELEEVQFETVKQWIATFDAGAANSTQVQKAIARILKQLIKLRGG